MTNNTSATSDRQDISSVEQLNNSWSTYHASIAEDYGVEESVFVTYVYKWIKHNIKNGRNVQDGRVWTYSSIGSIRKKIKCWTDSQFKLIVKKCVDKGLILVSKSQENKYDKTNWYSLTDMALDLCKQADRNHLGHNFQEQSSESNNIEKLEGSVPGIQGGCTIVVNRTLQSITDIGALAVYSYLATMPPSWIINAEQIRRHFGLGRDKAAKILKHLVNLGALTCEIERDASQRFFRHAYRLKVHLQNPLTGGLTHAE